MGAPGPRRGKVAFWGWDLVASGRDEQRPEEAEPEREKAEGRGWVGTGASHTRLGVPGALGDSLIGYQCSLGVGVLEQHWRGEVDIIINTLQRRNFIKFIFVVLHWRNIHIILDPVHEREANLWLAPGCQQGAKDQFISGMNGADSS